MNPPSALHSAMSRDRKPFTYTPGGINLSEIKSQRMAQRLMKNAMDPGIPEKLIHPIHNTATPIVPVILPNYNCLPVQVFPAMPANAKTLLRSRSNPDPRDAAIYRPVPPPASVNNLMFENNDTSHKDKFMYLQPTDVNRRTSLNEYSNRGKDNNSGEGQTAPAITNLYGNHYEATLPLKPVIESVGSPMFSNVQNFVSESRSVLPEYKEQKENLDILNINSDSVNEQISDLTTREKIETISSDKLVDKLIDPITDYTKHITVDIIEDKNKNGITEDTPTALIVQKISEENADIDDEQSELKLVTKKVTKDAKVQDQNGNQNGDNTEEAELSVKLPTKNQEAKTETKVEVEKKTLPDGSIEEVKTTTTRTTIGGRTEIKTRTETTIFPKAEESEEEVVEEEETEEEETTQNVTDRKDSDETQTPSLQSVTTPKENSNVTKTEERSEITITKKTAVVQEIAKPEQSEEIVQEEEIVEEEEFEEAEPVTIVLKKQVTPEPKTELKSDQEESEEDEEIVEEPEIVKREPKQEDDKADMEEEEEIQEEEEFEIEDKTDEKEVLQNEEIKVEIKKEVKEEELQEEEDDEEEVIDEETDVKTDVTPCDTKELNDIKIENKIDKIEEKNEESPIDKCTKEVKDEEITSKSNEKITENEHVIPIQISEESNLREKEEKPGEEKQTEYKIPIVEPSIPLDKVEDIEIKPIGITPIITKKHTENTEIITSTIDPSGGLSRHTEYNKIENIVTVNRTTKILDQNYESITQQGIPTVKTYFPPPSTERISTSPNLSRPYQSVYCPEPAPERRHSLLLERLSMERQMPADIYNQSSEQTQYQNEPQSEVLTVSNVKPSTITNQQWYQQTKQSQNTIYNNVTSNPILTSTPWAHPKSPQPQQQQYQPQQQYQTQQQYEPQQQYQPQPQYQPPQPEPQTQYQTQYQPPPQPQFQGSGLSQQQFQRGITPQPQIPKATIPQTQYQPSYTEPIRDKTSVSNSTYLPKPSWVNSTMETSTTPHSYLNKDTTQSYQRNVFSSTTQYSTGYVPPPWEQDSGYTSVNNTSEKYYQEVPQINSFSPTSTHGWKPTPPPAKVNKNAPIAYVPPAPNQSFVKPVVEVPRHVGRKTYYSEYERRYITVPESTYIPTETKFQPQPDPSPQYYYDNNEPSEAVEPQWRKELREFTEKSSQTQTIEQSNVKPPWEVDSQYAKTPSSTYTPTPTWSQTLRPQSNRERSFESDYVSQEWPKTNTRRRPLSMGVSTEGKIPDRVRGVSVDRYNPNSYHAPAEHPPVQAHTLTTPLPHANHHNPNIPAYHARASAETREQPIPYQQRVYREARASPLQSRSFKYLQWITGTEN